ncbi:hypothetical protein GCM10022243_47560 [Saccharothrix violaceirubra]|uniref:Uncharacterized protein n=1 Tax=Saccharothrix violaceirubra TaxID=413306 RepID=A0A7W7WXL4_9PSEU|nr:hypothetical protein [Saccharothrix violaceirubra]MBB4967505.1 hypothetical protein [Saccharothrix violaceirubra]
MLRATFSLGPAPTVDVIKWPNSDLRALCLEVRPDEVIVIGPTDRPGGAVEFAAYLREMASHCVRLAAQVDPQSGRHGQSPDTTMRALNQQASSWFRPHGDESRYGNLGETGAGRLPE